MRYLILNSIIVLIVFLITWFYNKDLFNKKWFLATLVLLVMTAIFDSLIVGNEIVAYNDDSYLNLFIGMAPIEDFAYTIAGMMIIPTVWKYLGSKE